MVNLRLLVFALVWYKKALRVAVDVVLGADFVFWFQDCKTMRYQMFWVLRESFEIVYLSSLEEEGFLCRCGSAYSSWIMVLWDIFSEICFEGFGFCWFLKRKVLPILGRHRWSVAELLRCIVRWMISFGGLI